MDDKEKVSYIQILKKVEFILQFHLTIQFYRGIITTLKLSPNLRLKEKPPKKGQNIDQNMLQVQKLDKLLSLVRELPEDTEAAAKDSDSSDSDT